MKPLRVLIAEDSEDDAALILRQLRSHGYDCTPRQVMSAEGLREALSAGPWDIVLCDYRMPGFDAPAALKIMREHGEDIPVIIVSGTIGEDVAVASLKQGAQDYILKQNMVRLGPAVESELAAASHRRHGRLLEAVAHGHAEVLEMILEGSPLADILTHVCNRVTDLSENSALCSVLLVDESRTHLVNGASPALPEEYTRAILPVKIGTEVGSCGRAAALKEMVVVEDVSTHPHWASLREVTARHGLRACWSVPVFSSGREVVATMAVYYRTLRAPSADELKWVESAARLVGVAVEQGRSAARLREQLDELLRWQNAMLNREDRVQQLKGEVNDLLMRLGDPIRYPSQA